MIQNQNELSVGSKVYYQPEYFSKEQFENGIVKEIPDFTTQHVRVVYNCAGNWDKFMDYTSALTGLDLLHHGWKED